MIKIDFVKSLNNENALSLVSRPGPKYSICCMKLSCSYQVTNKCYPYESNSSLFRQLILIVKSHLSKTVISNSLLLQRIRIAKTHERIWNDIQKQINGTVLMSNKLSWIYIDWINFWLLCRMSMIVSFFHSFCFIRCISFCDHD